MVRALRTTSIRFSLLAMLLPFFSGNIFAQQDPPSRVARLNYANGSVSMEPAGVDQWAPADINRPFTTGDYLYTDQGAQAELHLDVAVMRMGSQTSFGFLNLDDRSVQLKLTEGDMDIRLRNFDSDQVFEVDTPNAAVTLLGNGVYRFRVDANGNMSFVVVRQGEAQVTGGGQAFTLNSGNSVTLTGTDQLSYDVEVAPNPDQFDDWCAQRDEHEARLASQRYLPPTVIGYEDLDDYGQWQNAPDYGPVWYPQNVDQGWAPYQNGHWAWIEPWGYTWVDSMPWGFAPFHYGRWAYIGNRWGWCPGPIAVGYRGPVARPYYAPAMVAWFGGSHWGVGISLGGGPSLGWVPLGYGEVYTPPYYCSRPYFNNVNVYNTRVVNNVNITNVYNNVYVNKQVYNTTYVNSRAPNAVMAMPQTAFATGRAVRGTAVAVPAAQFARMQDAHVIAPPVAPTQQAVLGGNGGRPAPRPVPQVVQRQVVARNTPPPAPAPFAARQQVLQQHVATGQPVNFAAVRQAVPPRPAPATLVRQAPPARPVQVQPGQRVGTAAAAINRPAAPQPAGQQPAPGARPPAQPAPAVPLARPGQPQVNRPVQQTYPAAAAHPNQPPAPGVSRPTEPATPVARPQQPPQPAEQRAVQPVPPAGHGVPPNIAAPNQTRPAQPTPENGRVTERNGQPQTQPAYRPPQNNSGAAPQPPRNQEYSRPSAPAPQPPQQVSRPQTQERVQPAPARNEPPAPPSRPPVEERPQPPARNEPPAPPSRPPVEERPQPPARNEAPAPPSRPQVEQRPQPAPRTQAPPPEARYQERAPQTPPQPRQEEVRPAPRSEPSPQHGTPPPSKENQKKTDHNDGRR